MTLDDVLSRYEAALVYVTINGAAAIKINTPEHREFQGVTVQDAINNFEVWENAKTRLAGRDAETQKEK